MKRLRSSLAVMVDRVRGSLLSVSIRNITMTAYTLALKILTLMVVNSSWQLWAVRGCSVCSWLGALWAT